MMQRYKLLQRPNTTIFLLVLNFFNRGGGVLKNISDILTETTLR